MYIYYWN